MLDRDSVALRAHARATLDGKRVCVTGGRGALGTPLVTALLGCGVARVTTIGRSAPDAAAQEASHGVLRHFIANILDPAALDAAFRGCSVVFHLAGPAPSSCFGIPAARVYEINTLGTIQVIEACRRLGVSRLIFASTALVYGVPRRLPVDETHAAAPLSTYATSKLTAEIALEGASKNLGVRTDIARLSNVYGRSFDEGSVVGRALSHLMLGRTITVRDLTPVRDFLNEDDAADALIALACSECHAPGCRIVNVSSGEGVSVGEVIRTLARIAAGSGLRGASVLDSRPAIRDAIPAMVLDNALLRKLTGWSPRVSLEQGLRQSFNHRLQLADVAVVAHAHSLSAGTPPPDIRE